MGPTDTLAAVEEIKGLKARYFRSIDTKDWDGLREVFTTDASLDMSDEARRRGADPATGVTVGAAAIVERMRRALADVTTVHHGHTPEIAVVSATEATGVWAMEDKLWWHDPSAPLASLHGYGHYHEAYTLVDGGWRIATTRLARLRVDVVRH